MVDSIRVEMTRNKLRQAVKAAEFFKNNFPDDDNQDAKDYLSDLKSAMNQLEITNIHAEANRTKLRKIESYIEDHDHDLECKIIDSQVMDVEVRNYWNGINDSFGFYIEKRSQDDYLIIDDDCSLHFEGEVHTPGVRYKDVLRSMAYSDIHQFKDNFVMLASSEPEEAFENIEKYKQFLIESYSAHYDKIDEEEK